MILNLEFLRLKIHFSFLSMDWFLHNILGTLSTMKSVKKNSKHCRLFLVYSQWEAFPQVFTHFVLCRQSTNQLPESKISIKIILAEYFFFLDSLNSPTEGKLRTLWPFLRPSMQFCVSPIKWICTRERSTANLGSRNIFLFYYFHILRMFFVCNMETEERKNIFNFTRDLLKRGIHGQNLKTEWKVENIFSKKKTPIHSCTVYTILCM